MEIFTGRSVKECALKTIEYTRRSYRSMREVIDCDALYSKIDDAVADYLALPSSLHHRLLGVLMVSRVNDGVPG